MSKVFKAVKGPFGKSRHKKLPDKWGDQKEPVKEGVTFFVKYIGSTLLEELDDGQSYGDKISTEAVATVIAMAKASGKKFPNMSITISSQGIKVTNMDTKQVFTDMDIYRINFCTADSRHDRVFAYIARSLENETMECHAFLCQKPKIAEAVTLTVAQAFSIAQEEEEKRSQSGGSECSSPMHPVSLNLPTDGSSSSGASSPMSAESSPARTSQNSLKQGSPYAKGNANTTSENSMGFEDNFADMFISSPPKHPGRRQPTSPRHNTTSNTTTSNTTTTTTTPFNGSCHSKLGLF